jgi:hypothetical protein
VYSSSEPLNSVTAVSPSVVAMPLSAKLTSTGSTNAAHVGSVSSSYLFISSNCCATNSDRLTMYDYRCSDSTDKFFFKMLGVCVLNVPVLQ